MPKAGAEGHARATRDEYRSRKGKIKLYPDKPLPNLTPEPLSEELFNSAWTY
jgi:hypothetical protein